MWFRVALPFRAEWVVVRYLEASWVSVFKAQLLPHALRHQQTCSAHYPRTFRLEAKVRKRRRVWMVGYAIVKFGTLQRCCPFVKAPLDPERMGMYFLS